jgi:3-hydroxyisobutyrate dehydrogenase-like beta-hydroxyacid dehydrogenase
VFERCRPILEILGDPARIVRVGGHGAGYIAKLLVNLLWFGQAVATDEGTERSTANSPPSRYSKKRPALHLRDR